jgi:hypothetical protein
MAIQRRKAERIAQAFAYLNERWTTPFPVKLALGPLPEEVLGVTTRTGRSLTVAMNMRYAKWLLLDYLLHEFAHAITWSTERVESSKGHLSHHDEIWGATFARVYRDWHDAGGWKRSEEYDPVVFRGIHRTADGKKSYA